MAGGTGGGVGKVRAAGRGTWDGEGGEWPDAGRGTVPAWCLHYLVDGGKTPAPHSSRRVVGTLGDARGLEGGDWPWTAECLRRPSSSRADLRCLAATEIALRGSERLVRFGPVRQGRLVYPRTVSPFLPRGLHGELACPVRLRLISTRSLYPVPSRSLSFLPLFLFLFFFSLQPRFTRSIHSSDLGRPFFYTKIHLDPPLSKPHPPPTLPTFPPNQIQNKSVKMRFAAVAASLLAVVAAESTVYTTEEFTVISCAATVTNCPARSTVVR